jgi:uncharacterized protein YegP (UPF0339 family)
MPIPDGYPAVRGTSLLFAKGEVSMAAAKFPVYADAGQKWRWKLVSSNGQTIASSGESFSSRSSAQKAAENVKERAGSAEVVVDE